MYSSTEGRSMLTTAHTSNTYLSDNSTNNTYPPQHLSNTQISALRIDD